MSLKLSKTQLVWIGLSVLGWGYVYVFQEFDYTRMEFRFGQYAEGRIPEGENWRFVINKSVRFLLNDLFSLLFIYGLFKKSTYVKVGLVVMSFGLLILLPLYLLLATLYRESAFHLLTFLHRLTMNPWLMLLLVPAFFYSETRKKSDD